MEGSCPVTYVDMTITVDLKESAEITFAVTPADADFVLTSASDEVQSPVSSEDGLYIYRLNAGEVYSYTADADGFNSTTREFEAIDGDQVAVTLTESGQVTGGDNDINAGDGNYTISNGGTYNLMVGEFKSTVTISTDKPVTLVGSGTGKKSAAKNLYIDCTVKGVDLTLKDVYISNVSAPTGNMIDFMGSRNKLNFEGINILEQDTGASGYAMVHVNSSTSLTVTGGTAYLYKRDQGAGIGGNGGADGSEGKAPEYNGDITIDGADLFMKSSKQGRLSAPGQMPNLPAPDPEKSLFPTVR